MANASSRVTLEVSRGRMLNLWNAGQSFHPKVPGVNHRYSHGSETKIGSPCPERRERPSDWSWKRKMCKGAEVRKDWSVRFGKERETFSY